jgi:hypothetical protein
MPSPKAENGFVPGPFCFVGPPGDETERDFMRNGSKLRGEAAGGGEPAYLAMPRRAR